MNIKVKEVFIVTSIILVGFLANRIITMIQGWICRKLDKRKVKEE